MTAAPNYRDILLSIIKYTCLADCVLFPQTYKSFQITTEMTPQPWKYTAAILLQPADRQQNVIKHDDKHCADMSTHTLNILLPSCQYKAGDISTTGKRIKKSYRCPF